MSAILWLSVRPARFRRLGGMATLALTLALSGVAPSPAAGAADRAGVTPPLAPNAGPASLKSIARMVFQSKRDGNWEIYIADGDASGDTRLTDNPANDMHPRLNRGSTRVAFASNRDGNDDIYVMNADGSGLTRLTTNLANDTDPFWSPDGTRLLFTSDRDGNNEIYVMSADGTNQTRLTNNPASDIDAAYAPDGATIAFVSDRQAAGGAGRHVWLMDANGDNPRQFGTLWGAGSPIFSPDGSKVAFEVDANTDGFSDIGWAPLPAGATTILTYGSAHYLYDQRLGSWSPDGQWLVKSSWTYFSCGGLCLNQNLTFYFGLATPESAAIRLTSSALDTDVDWQTADILPPVSAITAEVTALGAASVPVHWSAVDQGPAGVASYDIQARRDDATSWTPVLTATALTSALISITPGYEYRLRIRARDAVGNVEAWPPDSAGNLILPRHWKTSGRVFDSAGSPVSGAQLVMGPVLSGAFSPSGAGGQYSATVAATSATVTATMLDAQYGASPPTEFPATGAFSVDYYLPPLDNVIADGDFEPGSPFAAAWMASPITAAVRTRAFHTGSGGLALGGAGMDEPANLSVSAADSAHVALALDDAGNTHALWQESDTLFDYVVYSARTPAGVWSAPNIVFARYAGQSGLAPADDRPQLVTDAAGGAHAMWRTWPNGDLYYASRPPGGPSWTSYLLESGLPASSAPRLAVSAAGAAHIVWHNVVDGRADIYYLGKEPGGAWQQAENLTAQDPFVTASRSPDIAVDITGTVFLAWQNGAGVIASRAISGAWTQTPVFLWVATFGSPRVAIGTDGRAHVAWPATLAGQGSAVIYATYGEGGLLAAPAVALTSTQSLTLTDLLMDTAGELHLAALRGDGAVLHATRTDGNWTSTPLSGVRNNKEAPALATAATGIWAVWRASNTGNSWLECRKWTPAAKWIDYGRCADGAIGAFAVAEMGGGRIGAAFVGGATPRETFFTSWPDVGAPLSGIAQAVTLPLTLTSPGLSFLYRFAAGAPGETPVLTVTVDSGEGVNVLLTRSHTIGEEWMHVWHSMTAWTGKTITLAFALESAEGAAQLLLDEVSLGSAAPNLWTALNLPPNAGPGSTAAFEVAYGNGGGGFAAGNMLTVTLPAGMSFVSADPAPVSAAPVLVWALTDMAGQTGQMSIQITATMEASSTLGSPLTVTAGIRTTTRELELANNDTSAVALLAYRAFAPVALSP